MGGAILCIPRERGRLTDLESGVYLTDGVLLFRERGFLCRQATSIWGGGCIFGHLENTDIPWLGMGYSARYWIE